MRLSAYEVLTILQKQTKLSREGIRDQGGPHPRVQQRILNQNPLYRVKDEVALHRILHDMGLLPWDRSWHFPLVRLRELQDQGDLLGIIREHEALFQMAVHIIDSTIPVKPSQRFGALFFAGLFLLPFASAKNKTQHEYRTLAKARASKFFSMFISELAGDDTPVLNLLKSHAAANIVVIAWNARNQADRCSDEMRDIVEQSGYFSWLHKQISIFPKLVDRPLNALAIASTFKWSHHYEQLQSALLAADENFSDLSKFSDDDFSDYRHWAAMRTTNSTEVTAMKKTIAKGIAVGGIAAALVTLIAATCLQQGGNASTSVGATQFADLRPHGSV